MKKFFLTLLIYSFCSLLNSATIEIKQDGSGDFTTIQAGINASVNGDTILVYPGRYFESLNTNGRNIALVSLEAITGDADYIDSTIIDGNHENNCLQIRSGETGVLVQGFSLCNGWANQPEFHSNYGGGIFIGYFSNVTVKNCKIYDNHADCGGGPDGHGCSSPVPRPEASVIS